MKHKQTRRKFIINATKVTASIIGAITLGKYFSFSQSTDTNNQIMEHNQHYRNDENSKILITYEGQFGSTKEVANAIGSQLGKNNSVIIKHINNVKKLNSFDKIIIGSAIQYDKWMPKTIDFIISNQTILETKKVAYFFTCLVLSKKTIKATKKANGYATQLINITPKVKPLHIGKFAGVLDYSRMSRRQRFFAKTLFAIIGVKEGDYRNWNAIKFWTNSLFI